VTLMLTTILHSQPTLTEIGAMIMLVMLAIAALAMFRPPAARSESLESVDGVPARDAVDEWRP